MNQPILRLSPAVRRLLYGLPGFAVYRFPWADACHLVVQTEGLVEQPADPFSVVERPGFVMVPFRPDKEHPAVRIRPDLTAYGREAIERALATLPLSDADTAVHNTASGLPAPLDAEEELSHYRAAFSRFMEPLRQGSFRKLVLSRSSVMEAPDGFSPFDTFNRACQTYPRMLIYLCHTPVTGTWLGCTPEILLSGRGNEWHTVALAGTQPMQGETLPEHWDEKNRREQALVADYIRDIVHTYTHDIEEQGPYTARAGQVAHLKTDFRFRLPDPGVCKELLQALHPTPAVCGLPKAETQAFIPSHEGYDRSYYSGFVGRVDAEGQTDLYVNLRCMQTDGRRIRLYAGGGILPSSEVTSEWEETQEKMNTLRRILQ